MSPIHLFLCAFKRGNLDEVQGESAANTCVLASTSTKQFAKFTF